MTFRQSKGRWVFSFLHGDCNKVVLKPFFQAPELKKESTECPCKSVAPEICQQFEGVFKGVCEAINPEYEFAYDV
jgi:hypothetical protein